MDEEAFFNSSLYEELEESLVEPHFSIDKVIFYMVLILAFTLDALYLFAITYFKNIRNKIINGLTLLICCDLVHMICTFIFKFTENHIYDDNYVVMIILNRVVVFTNILFVCILFVLSVNSAIELYPKFYERINGSIVYKWSLIIAITYTAFSVIFFSFHFFITNEDLYLADWLSMKYLLIFAVVQNFFILTLILGLFIYLYYHFFGHPLSFAETFQFSYIKYLLLISITYILFRLPYTLLAMVLYTYEDLFSRIQENNVLVIDYLEILYYSGLIAPVILLLVLKKDVGIDAKTIITLKYPKVGKDISRDGLVENAQEMGMYKASESTVNQ